MRPRCVAWLLGSLVLMPALATPSARAEDLPSSHLTVSVVRYADTAGNSPYYLFAHLWLADAESQQVVATIVGDEPREFFGTSFTRRSEHEWFADIGAATLEQLQSFASGTWTIEVFGTKDSSMSEFMLDLSKLTDADLPPTPTISSPTAFARDVPRTVQFVWTNPWTAGTGDRLEIEEWSANGCGPAIVQSLSSVDGGIAAGATSWQPPAPLGHASNIFRVTTTRVATPTQVTASAMQVLFGDIRWGEAPGSPPDQPSQTPLVQIGSHRMTSFEVEAPRQGDFNGDGVVDGDDLGTLLGNWG